MGEGRCAAGQKDDKGEQKSTYPLEQHCPSVAPMTGTGKNDGERFAIVVITEKRGIRSDTSWTPGRSKE